MTTYPRIEWSLFLQSSSPGSKEKPIRAKCPPYEFFLLFTKCTELHEFCYALVRFLIRTFFIERPDIIGRCDFFQNFLQKVF